jgi:hypothetical protein
MGLGVLQRSPLIQQERVECGSLGCCWGFRRRSRLRGNGLCRDRFDGWRWLRCRSRRSLIRIARNRSHSLARSRPGARDRSADACPKRVGLRPVTAVAIPSVVAAIAMVRTAIGRHAIARRRGAGLGPPRAGCHASVAACTAAGGRACPTDHRQHCHSRDCLPHGKGFLIGCRGALAYQGSQDPCRLTTPAIAMAGRFATARIQWSGCQSIPTIIFLGRRQWATRSKSRATVTDP